MNSQKKAAHFLNLESKFERDALLYVKDSKINHFKKFYNILVIFFMFFTGLKYLVFLNLNDKNLVIQLGGFGFGPMGIQFLFHIGHAVAAFFIWKHNTYRTMSFLKIYQTQHSQLLKDLEKFSNNYLKKSKICYRFVNCYFMTFVLLFWGSSTVIAVFINKDLDSLIKYTIPSCFMNIFVWYYLIRHAVYFHFLIVDISYFVQQQLKKISQDFFQTNLNFNVQSEQQINQIFKLFIKIYNETYYYNQIISKTYGSIYLFGYIIVSFCIYLIMFTTSKYDQINYSISLITLVILTYVLPYLSIRELRKPVKIKINQKLKKKNLIIFFCFIF